jgi:ABC-type branched-subunit amino acid transport system substrate-binding protein
MKVRTTTAGSLALLLASAVALAGCGREATPPATTGNHVAGSPTAVSGFDGTTIKLGAITAQSGPVKAVGDAVTNGEQTYWSRVNAAGGIGGKYKVQLVAVDGKYDPTTSVQQYNGIKNDVVMFNMILGTAPVMALLPQLATDKMVALPGSVDATWTHNQNLLPIAGSYQTDGINGMSWYFSKGGGSKTQTICFAGQSDSGGDAGFQGLQYAADKMGFTIAAKALYKAGDTDLTAAVQQLKAAKCQVVFINSAPTPVPTLLSTAAQLQFAPTWLGLEAPFVGALMKTPLKAYLQNSFVAFGSAPQWGDTSVAGMAQMMGDVQKYAPTQAPNSYFTFGYAGAWAVNLVLEAAVKAGDLSHDGIITAMNGLDKIDLAGMYGVYTYGPPAKRSPARTTVIYRLDATTPEGVKVVENAYTSDEGKAFQIPVS